MSVKARESTIVRLAALRAALETENTELYKRL